MPMSPRLLRPRATSALVAVDADARTYINAVRTADGGQYMEAGVQRAIDAFVTGCKTDGIWSAIKASCILMGAHTLSGALTPLVGTAPTNNNFVSGDYNRKTGLLGNGSTKYLDSNRANNVGGQNDRHNSSYVTTLPASGGIVLGAGGNGIGCTNIGRSGDQLFVRAVPGEVNASLNLAFHSQTIGTGFWGVRRAANTEFLIRAQSVTDTITASDPALSGTPSSDNLFIFARNNGSGTAAALSTARIAWYSLGDALDLSLLDSRVSTLYTAIGAAIP